MKTLRYIIVIALATVLGLTGCATSPSQRAYSPPKNSDYEYWKKKYEAERKKNRSENVVEAMDAFAEGMKGINRNLDSFNKRMFD